jgi:hypothetical protein
MLEISSYGGELMERLWAAFNKTGALARDMDVCGREEWTAPLPLWNRIINSSIFCLR